MEFMTLSVCRLRNRVGVQDLRAGGVRARRRAPAGGGGRTPAGEQPHRRRPHAQGSAQADGLQQRAPHPRRPQGRRERTSQWYACGQR